jgi:hypothetical protein
MSIEEKLAARRKELADQSKEANRLAGEEAVSNFWSKVAKDNLFFRFRTAVFAALLVSMVWELSVVHDWSYWLLYGVFFLQMFRNINHYSAAQSVWKHSAFIIAGIWFVLVFSGLFLRDYDYVMPMTFVEFLTISSLGIPAMICYLLNRLYKKKEMLLNEPMTS